MTTGRINQVFIKASVPGMRGSMQSITGRCRHLTRRAWEIVTQRGLRLCETCHCKCRKLSVRTSSANAVAHKLDNGTMLSNESMTGIGNTTTGSQHTQYVWTREQLLIAGSKMHARISTIQIVSILTQHSVCKRCHLQTNWQYSNAPYTCRVMRTSTC